MFVRNMRKEISLAFVTLFIGIGLGYFGYSMSHIPAQINSAVLLLDEDYFPVVLQAINSANESIYVALFEMKYYSRYPDSETNQLIDALIKAANRGVNVTVLLDEYANRWNGAASEVITYLRRHGVRAKLDSPDITTHTKVLVIDRKIIIIGSTNWSYHALNLNHEASVLIYSPKLAEQFIAYFDKIWDEN